MGFAPLDPPPWTGFRSLAAFERLVDRRGELPAAAERSRQATAAAPTIAPLPTETPTPFDAEAWWAQRSDETRWLQPINEYPAGMEPPYTLHLYAADADVVAVGEIVSAPYGRHLNRKALHRTFETVVVRVVAQLGGKRLMTAGSEYVALQWLRGECGTMPRAFRDPGRRGLLIADLLDRPQAMGQATARASSEFSWDVVGFREADRRAAERGAGGELAVAMHRLWLSADAGRLVDPYAHWGFEGPCTHEPTIEEAAGELGVGAEELREMLGG